MLRKRYFKGTYLFDSCVPTPLREPILKSEKRHAPAFPVFPFPCVERVEHDIVYPKNVTRIQACH